MDPMRNRRAVSIVHIMPLVPDEIWGFFNPTRQAKFRPHGIPFPLLSRLLLLRRFNLQRDPSYLYRFLVLLLRFYVHVLFRYLFIVFFSDCFMIPLMEPKITGTALASGNLHDAKNTRTGKFEDDPTEVKILTHHVDEMMSKVDELEQKVNEVEQFYLTMSKKQLNNLKSSSVVKDKDKEKPIASIKKQPQDASKREAAAAKRMQELMRQFSTILRQITQHKWAWPFMQPVDVEGLGLHDYYEVIEKPMDFSTIKNQMEAKDGTGYKNVREICADVRLVFKNAMTYNDERSDVHVMAKTLLEKFEEKWLLLYPKVVEEETRRKEEEAEAQFDMQLAREAANAKLASDVSNELHELDWKLEELREMVVQKCRKMSTEEKRKIAEGLAKLCPEDLKKALDIIAQKNPSFQATVEEVELDMDAQGESTLWRLKFFVKEALDNKGKNSATKGGNDNSKRKREICDALAKSAKRRSKKISS